MVEVEGRCLTDGAGKFEPPSGLLLILLLLLLLLLGQLSLNIIPPLLLLAQGGRGHDQVRLNGCSAAAQDPSTSNPTPTPKGCPVVMEKEVHNNIRVVQILRLTSAVVCACS